MIDWTKPIRDAETKQPARLLHTLKGESSYPRVVLYTDDYGERCNNYPDDTEFFENVPPPRREYWVNVYRSGKYDVDITSDRYLSREAAERGAASGCLGQALLYIENP